MARSHPRRPRFVPAPTLLPSAPPPEPALSLLRTADLLVKRIGELARPFDLTPASGRVLNLLADSPAPLPPNAIAARLIISRATVTGLLDSLERRGYVQRQPHASDRRMLLIALTDSGRAVAQQFREVVHRHQRDWLGTLSEREQKQLLATLHRLQDVLGEAGE